MNTPTVCFDARLVDFGGIGRFIVDLWTGLARVIATEGGPDLKVITPATRRGFTSSTRSLPALPSTPLAARPFLPIEQLSVPRAVARLGANVYHSPQLSVPYLSRVPVVLTVHDLFPLREAGLARSRVAQAYYRSVFPRAVRRADRIVAVSQYAVDELEEVLNVDPSTVTLIEHGLDHERWYPDRGDKAAALLAPLALPDEYLLYVGAAKPHKNVAVLLRAHNDELPPLVIAGATRDDVARGTGMTPGPGVRVLGPQPEALLRALYSGAAAVALPSRWESVGFTAWEAMACGAPVVASTAGGIPRTVGDAAVLVDPDDVAGWRDALRAVILDGELRTRLVNAGARRVAPLHWDTAARRYLEVYRDASR